MDFDPLPKAVNAVRLGAPLDTANKLVGSLARLKGFDPNRDHESTLYPAFQGKLIGSSRSQPLLRM
jgi:hypothetical protein